MKAVAAKLKALGVKAGIPDLVLPMARGGIFGLHIEFKTTPPNDAALSDSQHKRIRKLNAQERSSRPMRRPARRIWPRSPMLAPRCCDSARRLRIEGSCHASGGDVPGTAGAAGLGGARTVKLSRLVDRLFSISSPGLSQTKRH